MARGLLITRGATDGSHWRYSVALLQLLETIWLQQFKKFLLWLVLSDNFPGSGSLSPKRAACRSPAWWPGAAQHLSMCWGGLSNDWYPDLAGTWVLASSAATVLGTDILNHHTKMCQSLVWLRYNTQSLSRDTGVTTWGGAEGEEKQHSAKRVRTSV